MGGSGAMVETPQSVEGIWRVTRKLGAGDTSKFFNFRGETLPW
jgi:hypothetical protein